MKSLSMALGKLFSQPKVKAPRVRHKTRAQLDAIATTFGITIEKDSQGGYWLLGGPASLDGERFCGDLAEVQDALEAAHA